MWKVDDFYIGQELRTKMFFKEPEISATLENIWCTIINIFQSFKKRDFSSVKLIAEELH